MEFQRHKISLTGTLVLTLICLIATTESNVKHNDEQTMVNGCHGGRGRDGRDGRDGIQGPYGPPGLPGNAGTCMSSEFERKFEEMQASVEEKIKHAIETGLVSLQNVQIGQRTESRESVDMLREKSSKIQQQLSTGGSTYVRWGRNVCPPKTLKLYSGFLAGPHYTQKGSGSNHVCLPKDPQWNRTVAGHQSGSYLHGTEFELQSNSRFHRNNAGGKSQHNHDAQCAVCQTPGRLTQLMIPARLECPSGWNLEYLGFLMAQHNTQPMSEYVCVDQDPDVDPATSANKNGNLLYQVEVVCGSLPCPPYVDGYEVTCVVCTQ